MKRFTIEVFILLTLFITTFNTLYNLNKTQRLKNLEEKKGKIEIVNFGTSHGADFNYAFCPLTSIYFNYSGNTLYYDLQNFRFLNSKGYLAPKAIIVIPVSYFVFGLDENRTDGGVGDAFANQFYEYLPPKYIHNYSLKKEVELKIYKVQNNFDFFFDKKKNKNSDKEKNIPEKNHSEQKNKTSKASDLEKKAKKLNKLAIKRVDRHKRLSKYSSEKKNEQYLQLLIQEAKEGGFQPILVTTPYYCDYNNYFGKEWLEKEYFSRIRNFALKNNIPYLNYSHYENITNNPSFFLDSDHLNNEGRAVFSELFFNDIENEISKIK